MMSEFGRAKDLYFGGDMEASIALSGQVCGRIDAIKPVAQIIRAKGLGLFKSAQSLSASNLR